MFSKIAKIVSTAFVLTAFQVITQSTRLTLTSELDEREKSRREKQNRGLPLTDYTQPVELDYRRELHAPALDLFFRHQLAVVHQTMLRSIDDKREQTGIATNDVIDPEGQRQLIDAARKVWTRLGLNLPADINAITAAWSIEQERFALSLASTAGVQTVHFLKFATESTLGAQLLNNAEINKRPATKKTFRNLYEQIQLTYYFHPEKAEA